MGNGGAEGEYRITAPVGGGGEEARGGGAAARFTAMSAHAVRVWDVFAGAGAMTHAMGEAIRARGFQSRVVALVESAEPERKVLSEHYPGVWTPGDVAQLAGLPQAEIGLAGYPCPGNSSLTTRFCGARGAGHPATRMVAHLLRLLDGDSPPVLVLENTTGCLSSPGGGGDEAGGDDTGEGGFFRWLVSRLAAAGYTHGEWRILSSSSATPPYSRGRVFLVAWRAPACLRGVLLGCGNVDEPERGAGLGLLRVDPGVSPSAGRVPALRASKGVAPSVLLPGGRPWELGLEAAHALHGLPPGYCGAGGGSVAQLKMLGNGVAAAFRLVAARVAEGVLNGRAAEGWERALRPGALAAGGAVPGSGAWDARGGGVELYSGVGAGEHVAMEAVGPASLRDIVALYPGREWSVEEIRFYVETAASLERAVGPRGGELGPLLSLGWGGWEGPGEGARVEVEWGKGRWYRATVAPSGRHPPHELVYDDGDVEDALVLPDRVVGPMADRRWRRAPGGAQPGAGGGVEHGEGEAAGGGEWGSGQGGTVGSMAGLPGAGPPGGGEAHPIERARGHAVAERGGGAGAAADAAGAWCRANGSVRHVKHDGQRMATCTRCVADRVASALRREDAAYVAKYEHWWVPGGVGGA